MSRKHFRAALILVSLLGSGAALAADVVEFSDGRYLEVRSHSVEGDAIRLEVDRGSFMVIPADSVDTIRREREIVYPHQDRPATPLRRAERRVESSEDPTGS